MTRRPVLLLLMIGLALPAVAGEIALRLTSAEVAAIKPVGNGAGTSGLSAIKTRILSGNPIRPGLYTIQIAIPPHTVIQAHSHRDDRTATVVSGVWFIGYGPQREVGALKALSPGSFYTEPAGEPHFAGTGDQAALVNITGFGPSDTRYVGKITP